jgi:hypothetical protein
MKDLRWLVIACACACGGSSGTIDAPGFPIDDAFGPGPGGGLPPPACGAGACSDCAGCSVRNELCFGSAFFAWGDGECTATGQPGSFQVDVAGALEVATETAAVVDGAQIEIAARSANDQFTVVLPAIPGNYNCTDPNFTGGFGYYTDPTSEFHNNALAARPPCTATVTMVGDVGGRIVGTFSATIVESAAMPATIQLTNGTFSVTRIAFP